MTLPAFAFLVTALAVVVTGVIVGLGRGLGTVVMPVPLGVLLAPAEECERCDGDGKRRRCRERPVSACWGTDVWKCVHG